MHLKRVLVVDDDALVSAAIARAARVWGAEVFVAGRVAEALALLSANPELLIVDVRLPDGDGLEVAREASRRHPAPTIIAVSGKATPAEAFRLASAGVRGYMTKPFGMDALETEVERVLLEAPSFEPLVAAWVGRTPMRSLQNRVRNVMVEEALARAHGSRSGAARLLNVSRQAVQQFLRGRAGRAIEVPEPGSRGPAG